MVKYFFKIRLQCACDSNSGKNRSFESNLFDESVELVHKQPTETLDQE